MIVTWLDLFSVHRHFTSSYHGLELFHAFSYEDHDEREYIEAIHRVHKITWKNKSNQKHDCYSGTEGDGAILTLEDHYFFFRLMSWNT